MGCTAKHDSRVAVALDIWSVVGNMDPVKEHRQLKELLEVIGVGNYFGTPCETSQKWFQVILNKFEATV